MPVEIYTHEHPDDPVVKSNGHDSEVAVIHGSESPKVVRPDGDAGKEQH